MNDNAPKIEIAGDCATISEFHDPKEVITLVKVKDDDDPALPNGRTNIQIISGNDKGKLKNIY